jgi:hypothetical protein
VKRKRNAIIAHRKQVHDYGEAVVEVFDSHCHDWEERSLARAITKDVYV